MSFKELADNTVLSIIAPTASGKTALAYELYETGNFELVSVDSALIYNDMDIGTAKPTKDELTKYPHYLVDIMTPEEQYNVSQFCCDVKESVEKIHNNNKIPILVGGTMMYYNAMFSGISVVPNTSGATRKKVMAWLHDMGVEDLYKYLKEHDPIAASRLNMNDTQRITRAVEVHVQTGRAISDWQNSPKQAIANNTKQNWLAYTATPNRALLHERIEMRLAQMWTQGFLEEVVALINKYNLSIESPAMRCIGYRQIIEALLTENLLIIEDGLLVSSKLLSDEVLKKQPHLNHLIEKNTCQDMRNKALYATRQLAKRQCTWLNKLNKFSEFSKVDVRAFDSMQQVKQQLL